MPHDVLHIHAQLLVAGRDCARQLQQQHQVRRLRDAQSPERKARPLKGEAELTPADSHRGRLPCLFGCGGGPVGPVRRSGLPEAAQRPHVAGPSRSFLPTPSQRSPAPSLRHPLRSAHVVAFARARTACEQNLVLALLEPSGRAVARLALHTPHFRTPVPTMQKMQNIRHVRGWLTNTITHKHVATHTHTHTITREHSVLTHKLVHSLNESLTH